MHSSVNVSSWSEGNMKIDFRGRRFWGVVPVCEFSDDVFIPRFAIITMNVILVNNLRLRSWLEQNAESGGSM